MRKGLGCIMQERLGWMVREEVVNGVRGKNKEVEKMRKGLSVIAGIAILLFAYSASAAVTTNGLISWWKFEETSGTNAADTWTGNNDGVLYNYGADGTWTNDTAGSASDGALVFDGATNYINCGNGTSLNVSAITMEAWLKPTEQKGNDFILTKYDGDFSYTFGIHYDYVNMLKYAIAAGGKSTAPEPLYSFTLGQWHHYVVTYDGTNIKSYVNTSLVDSVAHAVGGDIDITTADVLIGALQSGANTYAFNGILDDVRIYNRALTPTEIANNYNAIPEPSTLLLLGGGLLGLLVFRLRRKV